MKAKIVCLDMKHLTRSKQSRNSQKIYGYKDVSNHRKYNYYREGILSDIPRIILGRGVFVIYEKDKLVINKIKDLGVGVKTYMISIKKFS